MFCKCYEPTLNTTKGYCRGTKEVEPCNCEGKELNCDFYPEVREHALKETLEYKIRDAIDLLKKNGYIVYKEV